MSSRELQLRGDLRQAIENYLGDMVSGPWDVVIEGLFGAIQAGALDIELAGQLNLALRATHQDPTYQPSECPTCERGLSRHEGMRW